MDWAREQVRPYWMITRRTDLSSDQWIRLEDLTNGWTVAGSLIHLPLKQNAHFFLNGDSHHNMNPKKYKQFRNIEDKWYGRVQLLEATIQAALKIQNEKNCRKKL